jgi:Host cell surface-exposed lipoprotein/Protein of unknown function (DUF2510)/Glucodextranase, domain B
MAKSPDAPGPVRPLPSWVPAGWYPDPLKQGAARYWDGNRWSLEHRDDPPPQPVPTSPSEVPASPPPAAAVASSATREGQPNAQDRWRKIPKGGRIAIVIGAIIVLLAIIGAAAGSGSKKTTTTAAETSVATPPTPAVPPVALKLDTGDYSMVGSHTTIHGTVTAGAAVTVNEQPVHVHGTHWSTTVALQIGSNAMAVSATLAGRESSSRTITVTRNHTQAELEAEAQARKEKEREERKHKEAEEREEQEKKAIENATASQQNALKEAESYLHTSAFSEAGLIEQLSSEAGSKFPHQDAVWAVEHLHVNWDDQAVKEAESYLHTSSFSCQGLIEQLSSEAGSKFTLAQAEYGAKHVGLC